MMGNHIKYHLKSKGFCDENDTYITTLGTLNSEEYCHWKEEANYGTVKLGYNKLGYNKLGYNKLGYNKLGYNKLGC
jgi:hypothetical protein